MTQIAFARKIAEPVRSPRLELRAPISADVPTLARLANNVKIYKMLARLPHPYTVADANQFVDSLARTDTDHAFAITTRDGIFIGIVGLHEMADGALDLGYWLGEPYWGDGYATEAVTALLSALDETGCIAVHARAQAANIASRHILERIGFQKTGETIASCGPHEGVAITYYLREHLR